MKFSYTALSSDNQKLTGVLESENRDSAQEELHKMGVSIISIKEITDAEYSEIEKKEVTEKVKSGVITYSFLAIDSSGKEINGTIDARDPYSAYKRLITEYGFKIKELYKSGATEAEKTNSNKEIDDFESKIKDEGIDTSIKKTGADEELLEAGDKIDQKIIDEIDNFITNTKKVLSDHSDKFSAPLFKQIESTLGELERIRTSNNINHITEICNQVYELISNPDTIDPSDKPQNNDSYNKLIGSIESTGIVKKQFNIHSKSVNLSKIKSLFSKTFGMFTKSEGGKEKETFIQKIKKILGRNKKVLPGKKKPSTLKSKSIISLFFSFLSSSNPILRSSRKQQLIAAYRNWKNSKKESKKNKIEKTKKEEIKNADESKISKEKTDGVSEPISTPDQSKSKYSAVFSETDSFIGWLLFFYLIYFFLIDFSYEKNIGIPREFVAKTLKTPLIIDITIFLLITHLLFKLREAFFRNTIIGSFFLFFLGIGLYSLLILNF